MSAIGGDKRADKAGSGKTLLPARTAHTRYNSSINLRRSSSLTGTVHLARSRPLTLFSESGKVRLSRQHDNRPDLSQPNYSRCGRSNSRLHGSEVWLFQEAKDPPAQHRISIFYSSLQASQLKLISHHIVGSRNQATAGNNLTGFLSNIAANYLRILAKHH
jgi:hypothetical protein